MNQDEASQQRFVFIKNNLTDKFESYAGDQVFSVTEKGVVIAVMSTRILYPWHRIDHFTYHTQDVSARKAIQGY